MAIKITFPTGANAATVSGLYQWDYGQELEIESADLGYKIVEVHFSCAYMSEAIVRPCAFTNGVGTVIIPDACLEQASAITAWIYEIDGTCGHTIKTINIQVTPRTRPSVARDIPQEVCDKYTELITEVNETIDGLETGAVVVGQAKNSQKADFATSAGNAQSASFATSAGSANSVNSYKALTTPGGNVALTTTLQAFDIGRSVKEIDYITVVFSIERGGSEVARIRTKPFSFKNIATYGLYSEPYDILTYQQSRPDNLAISVSNEAKLLIGAATTASVSKLFVGVSQTFQDYIVYFVGIETMGQL